MRRFRSFGARRPAVARAPQYIEPEESREAERAPGTLLLPGPALPTPHHLAVASRAVLDAIRAQARDALGSGSFALVLDARGERAVSVATGEALDEGALRAIGFYCNAAYLLLDAPTPSELKEAARANGLAWCASPAS